MATHSLAVTSGSTKEEITMQKMESPGHKEIPKGRPPKKKNVYFRAFPKIAPPPPSPQFGQLGPLFYGHQKQCFVRMTEIFDHDNDGCNDNNGGNFEEKNTKKTYNYWEF